MTTEGEEWKPRNRYNDSAQNDDGQNGERRPYQSYNRPNYGNQNGNYNRQGGNYERQGGNYGQRSNYDRQGGNYDRPRANYDRSGSGNYDRSSSSSYDRSDRSGGNYNNRGNDSYNRNSEGGYNPRPQRSYDNNYQRQYDSPQRSYDNRPQESEDANATGKKRRPRVGDVPIPARNTNYNTNRPSGGYNQGGGYNQNSRGGYQQRPYNNNRPNQGAGPNRFNQGDRGAYNPNDKYSVKKQLKYREEHFDPNEPIRLNKYLANAGVCSRREADEFIQAGLVKVNGEIVTELGTKVKRVDAVIFHNETVKLEQKVYVLLNKPKNCVTTADDPQERLTVMDLVKTACQERIFPVGRLDRNTTGVLLLTNDGDLASKLTHPKFLKKKIYHVWLDKNVSVADMEKLAEGVELEDGEIHADAISYVTETDKDQVGIEIHSGRNRVVRRMFETLGYHVIKLDRVYFAGLTKKNLKRGQWRYLNEKEVSMLRMGAFD
ncbi:pseudouridine synthase [Bacteroidia bacterium]|nr:pseudouridine synthase [Bacteroidia bacterium]